MGADDAGTIARLRALRQDFIDALLVEYRAHAIKLVGDGAGDAVDSVLQRFSHGSSAASARAPALCLVVHPPTGIDAPAQLPGIEHDLPDADPLPSTVQGVPVDLGR